MQWSIPVWILYRYKMATVYFFVRDEIPLSDEFLELLKGIETQKRNQFFAEINNQSQNNSH